MTDLAVHDGPIFAFTMVRNSQLRDESIEDSANLPEPHVLAEEIADDLRASLEQIEDVLADLQARAVRLEKQGNTGKEGP
jgi:type I restriction enzyme M protein